MKALKTTAGILLLMFFVGSAIAQTGGGAYTLICALTGFEEGTKFFLVNLDNEQKIQTAASKIESSRLFELVCG